MRDDGQRRVARGASGAGRVRRLYRRSPVRRLIEGYLAHRGLVPSDIFCASYPRSGSGWLRIMLIEMLAGDATFVVARTLIPYIGRHRGAPPIAPGGARMLKTHEQPRREYQRALHLVRDPRDVVISYFHFMQRLTKLKLHPSDDVDASVDRFVEAFLAGHVDPFGTWQQHTRAWLDHADGPADILRVRYEDLLADGPPQLVRIAAWLGKPLTIADAAAVYERCSIERMRQLEAEATALGAFPANVVRSGKPTVREGRAGAWHELLTPAQQARFTIWNDALESLGYPPA